MNQVREKTSKKLIQKMSNTLNNNAINNIKLEKLLSGKSLEEKVNFLFHINHKISGMLHKSIENSKDLERNIEKIKLNHYEKIEKISNYISVIYNICNDKCTDDLKTQNEVEQKPSPLQQTLSNDKNL